MRRFHFAEMHVGQRVAVDDEKRVGPVEVDERQRHARTAGAAEHARLFPRVARADAEIRAVADDRGDRLRPMMEIEHDVADAVRGQPREDAAHERLAGDGNGRLRAYVAQGTKPAAETGCQKERRLQVESLRSDVWLSSTANTMSPAGMPRVSQSRM